MNNIRRFVRSVIVEAMKSSKKVMSLPKTPKSIYQQSLRDLADEWRSVERMTFDEGGWDGWAEEDIADEVMILRKDEMFRVICDYYGINSYDSFASELNAIVRQHFWDLRDKPGFM